MKCSDRVVYTSHEYSRGCMNKQNRYLVDNSSVCVCYQTKENGGNAYSVNYAKLERIGGYRYCRKWLQLITQETKMFVEIIPPDDVDKMVIYVSCGVQKAGYEWYKKNQDDISWDEYVLIVQRTEKIRKILRKMIREAVLKFKAFDFDNMEDINWNIVNGEGFSAVYEGNRGRRIIYLFMLKTERAFYNQLKKEEPSLIWDSFNQLILNNRTLYERLKKSFLRGLTSLDFNN